MQVLNCHFIMYTGKLCYRKIQQNRHFYTPHPNIKQEYNRSFINCFTLYILYAEPSTVSFQALRAEAEMKARELKRSVKIRDGTSSKIEVLQSSHVGF